MSARFVCLVVMAGLSMPSVAQDQAKTQTVSAASRLDHAFAAQGFGKDAARTPAGYDATKQRYQIHVPKLVRRDRPAPLVLFISPSDQPSGLAAWQSVCDQGGVLFVSPFAAGNNVPAGQRIRVILDVLDDVRRHYRVDSEQTYLSGFSGGGRMACAIAFALPEYFGGVVPMCGTNPPPGQAFLRHRLQDRLAVALVTGATDFNRKENEAYMAPWLDDLGIQSRLWVVPKMGHAVAPAKTVEEVYAWLKADLPRRQREAKACPKLAVLADEAPQGAEQARRWVEAAQDDLRDANRIWRGVALLQFVTQRWGKTEPGQKAAVTLKAILNDERLLNLIAEQGAVDEQKSLAAQARALERFGQIAPAIQAWEILAGNYEGTLIGKQARENVQRLKSKN